MLAWLNNIEFLEPWWFLLLLLLPLLIWHWFGTQKMRYPTFTHTDKSQFAGMESILSKFRFAVPLFKIFALILFVTALARPQSSLNEQKVTTDGIDIVLSLDVSESMLARDFKPNRLEASKVVAEEFITKRTNDRLGLVVFAGESFTQCPITTDHKIVRELLAKVETGKITGGTAIGMGLATAINRLKDSNAKSKVIILLTDGENNSGYIDPRTASELAKEFGIKVYTIGAGTIGRASAPVAIDNNGQYIYQMVEVKIDEALLEEIATQTGGKYFRATSKESLKNIYAEIDELEKTKIEVSSITRVSEEFFPLAVLGVILLLMSWLMKQFIFKNGI